MRDAVYLYSNYNTVFIRSETRSGKHLDVKMMVKLKRSSLPSMVRYGVFIFMSGYLFLGYAVDVLSLFSLQQMKKRML